MGEQKDWLSEGAAKGVSWITKNPKFVSFVLVPALLLSWDNLVGAALSAKAFRAGVIAIVEPIVRDQVQVAVDAGRADGDTIKAMIQDQTRLMKEQGELARQAAADNSRRFDKIEFAVARLYRESKRGRDYQQDQEETERARRGLFGKNP